MRRRRAGAGGPVRALSVVEDYVTLGPAARPARRRARRRLLRPAQLAAAVAAEELRPPAELAADADALLVALDGADLEESRRLWLQDQLVGVRAAATTPKRAASARRFISDPLWRASISTYSYGGALVRAHVDGHPERFGELLTRQVRVADVLPISSGT